MSNKNILKFLKSYVQFKDIEFLMQKFLNQGYEIFLVGGCVRDALLNRFSHDFDFATSAWPDQIESLFDKTLDYGKQFGTIAIVLNDVVYEVTTYRSEDIYHDKRHPKEINFSKNLTVDSQRRDFTVNALYADKEGHIHDPQNGLKDLQAKLINCVNAPADRFQEDALRMYRALRFASELGFKIEEQTFKNLIKYWGLTEKLSKERVYTEFKKTIIAPDFYLFLEEILKHKLHPDFFKIEDEKHISFLKNRMQQNWEPQMKFQVFLAEVLYFTNLNYQKASKTIESMQNYLALKKTEINWLKKVMKFLYQINSSSNAQALIQGSKLMDLEELKLLCSIDLPMNSKYNKTQFKKICKLANTYTKMPNALVSAKDLIQIGIQQGPELGQALEKAYECQITHNLKFKEQVLKALI